MYYPDIVPDALGDFVLASHPPALQLVMLYGLNLTGCTSCPI